MKRLWIVTGIALLVLSAGSATAQTAVKSSSPAAAITSATCTGLDGTGGVTDTIDILSATAGLTDVDVRVEIDHTFRSDLQFHVTYTGGGGTVILAADHGGFADNEYYATFDDAAGSPCSTVCSGTACSAVNAPGPSCQPDSALSAFNTLATPGTFTMALCDDAAGDEGTWQLWEITAVGPGLPVELLSFDIQ